MMIFCFLQALRSRGRRTSDLAVEKDVSRAGRNPEEPQEGGAGFADDRAMQHRAGHVISRNKRCLVSLLFSQTGCYHS
jgi:hypothetical protein